MRAAFCSSPMSVEPGRPEGRPRICATATATTGSRSAAAWRSRRNAGGWRSISAVVPATSRASTSGHPCTLCSDTCVAPWSSCGIAVPSTAAARCRPSSRPTRACTFMTSPRMRPSSTRPSPSGRRPTTPWPTAPPTLCSISGSPWARPSAGFAAPSPSFGRASTLPTCHGPDESFHYLRNTQQSVQNSPEVRGKSLDRSDLSLPRFLPRDLRRQPRAGARRRLPDLAQRPGADHRLLLAAKRV